MSAAPEAGPDPGRDLLRLLAASTPADRAVYGLVALLLLAAVALTPLLEAFEPRIAVTRAWGATRMETPEDPWGRPFRVTPEMAWSLGPDGIDQAGQGDDLVVLSPRDWRMRVGSAEGNLLFLGLAVALGGSWELARVVRRQLAVPDWSGPGREALRAAVIALPAAAVALGLALAAPVAVAALGPLVAAAGRALLVPFPVAVGGGAWLVVTLAVLWHRSRTAGREAGESGPPAELPPRPI